VFILNIVHWFGISKILSSFWTNDEIRKIFCRFWSKCNKILIVPDNFTFDLLLNQFLVKAQVLFCLNFNLLLLLILGLLGILTSLSCIWEAWCNLLECVFLLWIRLCPWSNHEGILVFVVLNIDRFVAINIVNLVKFLWELSSQRTWVNFQLEFALKVIVFRAHLKMTLHLWDVFLEACLALGSQICKSTWKFRKLSLFSSNLFVDCWNIWNWSICDTFFEQLVEVKITLHHKADIIGH